jgi:broad specificity phosphatase PhoE
VRDDGPLTAVGRVQARAAGSASALGDDDRLVSSSLRRAVETAAAFGRTPA